MEELAVFLAVVPPSDTGAVTAITPSKVTQGAEITCCKCRLGREIRITI